MKLNCAMIDDDKVFLQTMRHFFEKVDYLNLVGDYSNPVEALHSIDFSKIDILFLDMEMPQMTGTEFLDALSFAPPVVFISKKKEYATEAFDYNAIDYLHKPVSFQRFLKTAGKIRAQCIALDKKNENNQGHLFIRVDGYWLKQDLAELQIIKADNNNVFIKTTTHDYKCTQRLKELVNQLPKKNFMQVHRSFIVNLAHINKVDGEILQVGNRIVPVSKTFLDELYSRLNIPR